MKLKWKKVNNQIQVLRLDIGYIAKVRRNLDAI